MARAVMSVCSPFVMVMVRLLRVCVESGFDHPQRGDGARLARSFSAGAGRAVEPGIR